MEALMFLQTFGFFRGGALGNLLAQWEALGVFSYAIPFLLIFALVFGILTQLRLFKDNTTINAIIALSVGLMALQFDFVPRFFAEIFPRLGVGIIIILIIMILTGLFMNPEDKWQMYIMWAVSVIVVIVILLQTAGTVGWFGFLPWLGFNWPAVLAVVAFLVILAIVIGSSRPSSQTEMKSPLAELLRAAGPAKT